jgi:BMFP domain-containing protein YqiC
MQSQSKLIDDLARVASSALGVATGMRHEAETQLRRQFERILADMDLVTREEFEVVRTIAETARAEQEALEERLAALEAQLAKPQGGQGAGKSAASKGKAKSGAKARSAGTTTAAKPAPAGGSAKTAGSDRAD